MIKQIVKITKRKNILWTCLEFNYYLWSKSNYLYHYIFCTTWKRPNEYPPISIQPRIAEIIVDLLLWRLIAFSIISFTSSLFIKFDVFGLVEVILDENLKAFLATQSILELPNRGGNCRPNRLNLKSTESEKRAFVNIY